MNRRIFQKTIVKWILSLSVFISLIIVAISSSLYGWYAAEHVGQYSRMSVDVLHNTANSMEILDESIMNTGFLTLHDLEIASMMNSHDINYSKQYTLKEKLIHMMFTSPLVSSAYLVNRKADWLIGSPANDLIRVDDYSGVINDLIRDRKQEAIIRMDTYPSPIAANEAGIDTISYVFFQTRDNTADDSFLIMNVRQSDMVDQLASISPMKDSQIFAINRTGKVVISQDKAQLYREYGEEKHIQRILGSAEAHGFFIEDVGMQRSLVTYVSSDALSYTFISITPYDVVLQTSIALKLKTVLLSVGILLAGLIASSAIAGYWHMPLRRLVNKYAGVRSNSDKYARRYRNEFEILEGLIDTHYDRVDSLDQFVNENLPILRQDFFKNMLEGHIRLDNEISMIRLREIGSAFSEGRYQVILIHLKPAQEKDDVSLQLPSLKRRVAALAEETMAPICSYEIVSSMSDNDLVLLLNYGDGDQETADRIRDACLLIQQRSQQELEASATLIVGSSHSLDVHESYRQVQELSQYMVKYGTGSFIDEEKVDRDIAGHDLSPEQETKQLMKELRNLSLPGCEETIRQLIGKLYGYSINDIVRAIHHILYSTLQTAKDMIQNRQLSMDLNYFATYEQLMKFESLAAIEQHLIAFYKGTISELEQHLNKREDARNPIVLRVIRQIELNYNNPNLSLDYAAQEVNLNPNYLGKLFKDSEGIPFTEYVSRQRMKLACKLLSDTNYSVARIADEVGFNSSAYFVTCFKQYTGMTPTAFRKVNSEDC